MFIRREAIRRVEPVHHLLDSLGYIPPLRVAFVLRLFREVKKKTMGKRLEAVYKSGCQ